MWAIVSILFVIIAIVLGFVIIGSPRTQRLIRYDEQKVSDLQNIQSQVIQYWQQKGKLPDTLADVNDPLGYMSIPVDPQAGISYVYTLKNSTTFDLCAVFNRKALPHGENSRTSMMMYSGGTDINENWKYNAGLYCFTRTIDPQRYPPSLKMGN